MCGRYARKSTQELIASWFGVELEDAPSLEPGFEPRLEPSFEPTFNAAPQSVQPVVRLNRDSGRREFALARWGLVPFWAKEASFGYSTINARAEEVVSKAAFREAFKKRRCLVPADAFYEWQQAGAPENRQPGKQTGKLVRQPYAIGLKSGEPYALAGLWERWQPKDGAPLETFTILTTDPNALMEPIHNRMPVILQPQDYERWLEPGDPQRPPIDLLRPYPAEEMEAWPVSERVGNVRNNDAELLIRQERQEKRQPAQAHLFTLD
jgi:putative SOS response-associated peptidase YedK